MGFLVNEAEDPPSPPALLNPQNQVKMNILGPIDFAWSPSQDPDWKSSVQYRLEFGTAADLGDAMTIEGLTGVKHMTPGPLENTTYYWRLTATDNTGLQTPSEIQAFILDTRPSVPQPIVPETMFELTPQSKLSWTRSLDPNPQDEISYEFQIGLEFGTPTAPVSGGSGVQGNQVDVAMNDVLGDNQVYIWQVRAVDNHGIASEWSKPAKFFYNMANDPPKRVERLLQPGVDQEVRAVNLAWEPASDVDFSDPPERLSYKVELSRAPDFSAPGKMVTTQPGSVSLALQDLEDDARWFWRVRAADDDGAEGPVSNSSNFIYNSRNDPPEPVPELTEPADQSEVGSAVLRWSPARDKDLTDPPEKLSYIVDLATSPEFPAGSISLKTPAGVTSAQPAGLAGGTRWFWRVRAVDDDGAQGPASSVRSFSLKSTGGTPGR
jgi:hypothetical protein